jgi:hypothetical protein
MFQMAGALGAMSVMPQSLAAKPFLSVPAQPIAEQAEEASSNDILDYLEAVEDLQDDVDCVELVGRYVQLAPGDPDRDDPFYRGTCPFCKHSRDKLLVREERFHCMHISCDMMGAGDKWFAQIEKVPLHEAVRQLQGMLERGELIGRQKRFETQCTLLEELAGICHSNLLHHPCGTAHRPWLNALTRETIHHYKIGLFTGDMLSSFCAELQRKGWPQQEIEALGLALPQYFEIDPYLKNIPKLQLPEKPTLVMPVRDDRGRVLGFVEPFLVEPNDISGCLLPPSKMLSPQRWWRLVLHDSRMGSGTHGDEPLLLTCNPWDAVLLWQEGFESAVAPVGHWNDRNLRRVCALKTRLVYAASKEILWSEDFMSLLSLLGSDAARLDIAVLPKGMTATNYLRKHGAQALHDRIDAAVPVGQILKV